MKKNEIKLTTTRLNRFRVQGFTSQSNCELNEMAFGIRFAYRACVSVLLVGVSLANIPLLSIMMVIAIGGAVLPNHPFDYVYNYVLSKWMKKPQLPARSAQLKFSCSIAALWIGATIYSFYSGNMLTGYLLGGTLIVVASLLSTIDLCIPSIIYNALFGKNTRINA